MLNEIKMLESNLSTENLEKAFAAYERLKHAAPRLLISIGKPNREAAEIHAALDSLLNAMREMDNAESIQATEDQYEG